MLKAMAVKKDIFELYRGSEYEVDLLPKTKIDVRYLMINGGKVVEAILALQILKYW
ncbi:MAG: hypothetical protein Ct9H90mP4_12300 [Gammaproteobacteria bacterium]|nr:MAG: hypothetical protein Ct9H90mP4_12300 [Gammaproteobacteria bacterium]